VRIGNAKLVGLLAVSICGTVEGRCYDAVVVSSLLPWLLSSNASRKRVRYVPLRTNWGGERRRAAILDALEGRGTMLEGGGRMPFARLANLATRENQEHGKVGRANVFQAQDLHRDPALAKETLGRS